MLSTSTFAFDSDINDHDSQPANSADAQLILARKISSRLTSALDTLNVVSLSIVTSGSRFPNPEYDPESVDETLLKEWVEFTKKVTEINEKMSTPPPFPLPDFILRFTKPQKYPQSNDQHEPEVDVGWDYAGSLEKDED